MRLRRGDGSTGNELRGISCLALEEVAPTKKQIIASRSFGQPVHGLPELSEAIVSHVSRAAEKLRGQDGICNAIHVFIHTNPFREQDPQYSSSIVIPCPMPARIPACWYVLPCSG
jgi:DNA polymerase V